MKRMWISMQSPYERDMLDLEVPGEKPLQALMSDLVRAMSWPETRDGQRLYYTLATEDGQPIDPEETLSSAGLRPQSIVRVLVDTRPFIPVRSRSLRERGLASSKADGTGDVRDSTGALRARNERAPRPAESAGALQCPPGWKKLDDPAP